MPEGDTIFRTAVRLRELLNDQTIVAARSRDPLVSVDSLVGHRISSIEARGKHLLIHCSNQVCIHSHMGMTGSWHTYLPNERWQKPARRATLVIEVANLSAVCFSPKTLEILSATALRRHRWLSRLGPDLLSNTFDEEEAVRRMRTNDASTIGEALLNQSIVCGIGNVYKSEVLFLREVSPFQTVGEMSDDDLKLCLSEARALMLKNLQGYPRQTRFGTDGSRKWVYGRQGQSCLKCGETVAMRRQGDLGRSTYWCPRCQGRGE